MQRPELNNEAGQTRTTDDASNGERPTRPAPRRTKRTPVSHLKYDPREGRPLRSTEEAEEALARKHKERRRYWAMMRRGEAGLDARIADAVARDTR
jgi:hypothetical protein